MLTGTGTGRTGPETRTGAGTGAGAVIGAGPLVHSEVLALLRSVVRGAPMGAPVSVRLGRKNTRVCVYIATVSTATPPFD